MSKIGVFFTKLGKWIVANKVKSIIIGSAAAIAVSGTATGVALATRQKARADNLCPCNHHTITFISFFRSTVTIQR